MRDRERHGPTGTEERQAMCTLYSTPKSREEVAAWFRARRTLPDVVASNAPDELLHGAPGMVVREEAGERVLQSMVWGFPLRLATMKPGSKPKPVVNIADLAKPMWKGLAAKPASRCLIPLSAFAEPAGPAGARTRTWVTIKGQPPRASPSSPGAACGATAPSGARSIRAR